MLGKSEVSLLAKVHAGWLCVLGFQRTMSTFVLI